MNRYMMEGVGLTILGGILWGFSGMCSQFLQQFRHVRAEWLVPIRLLLAGVITLGLAYSQKGKDIFNVWRCKRDVLDLVIFAVFGIGLCQYSYFKSIYYAGAGIATVLQYLGPSFIIIYSELATFKMASLDRTTQCYIGYIGDCMYRFARALGCESDAKYYRLLGAYFRRGCSDL